MHFVPILPAAGEFFTSLGLSLRERETFAGRFEFFTFCRFRAGSIAGWGAGDYPTEITRPPPAAFAHMASWVGGFRWPKLCSSSTYKTTFCPVARLAS
jgi:hypothetical protein